jgi:hypothetical protein
MSEPYRLRAARPPGAGAVHDVLGPPVRGYYAAAHRGSIVAASPFVLLLAYVVWLAHQGQLTRWFNSTFSVGAVSTLFVLSIVLIAYTSAVGGGELLRVHANGILDLRAGPRAVPWDEVESLTAVWGPDGRGVLRHLLRTQGGATLSLGRSIAGVDELVEEIRTRMTEQRTPALRARIDEGDVVRFGAMTASDKGITVGPRVIAWDEVAEVEGDQGEVVVRGRDGASLAAARLDEVPNAFLLAEIAHSHRGSGRT